jgi:hypothetical protein
MGIYSGQLRRGTSSMPAEIAPAPRPDLAAYDHAVRQTFPVVVKEIRELLGAKLVAYIAGVAETRAVHEWADGVREPRGSAGERLRFALRVGAFIAERDGAGVAQAWFQGLNPQLDDRSPARLLREGDLHEVGPQILAAARAFVVGG